ncbi:MAG: hypothetical protein MI861_01015, partial [Pirellulales bacterium]|nr:hypothetical protein [Pirellulales bacterium]
SMRASDPLMVLFRLAQLPLFCVLIFLLWLRFWRTSDGKQDPVDAQSLKMLRQVDRFARRHKLIRQRAETLHQFAARIEAEQDQADADSTRLKNLARWYRQYAEARYRGGMPVAFKT